MKSTLVSAEISTEISTEISVEINADRPSWMNQAACKGRTNLFFGIAGERPERRIRREESARKVCAECPVLIPCRDLARINRENGFWGGETEEERAASGHAPRSISRRSVQEAAIKAS